MKTTIHLSSAQVDTVLKVALEHDIQPRRTKPRDPDGAEYVILNHTQLVNVLLGQFLDAALLGYIKLQPVQPTQPVTQPAQLTAQPVQPTVQPTQPIVAQTTWVDNLVPFDATRFSPTPLSEDVLDEYNNWRAKQGQAPVPNVGTQLRRAHIFKLTEPAYEGLASLAVQMGYMRGGLPNITQLLEAIGQGLITCHQ